MTNQLDNPIRELAERWQCSVDDILDMAIEGVWKRYLELQAETAFLEAKRTFLEQLRDDIEAVFDD
ncbi:hypothetical protein [Amycolatopsis taiwanensis]|uniref:Uncharacterized protein n=1 Tax=Amycolatopsis taiwanensis TaxID=342230 RepID=A0A9W6VAF6_9PSEU|nr:hypothetical protein [Amycolatopsis taiwanensis]GLY63713.1 hypothetical protein Atai01_03320 [Amycolatopsis taiwanensis]